MTSEDFVQRVVAEFGRRKFAAALAIAFIDLIEELSASDGQFASFEQLLKRHRRIQKKPDGGYVNTLVLEHSPGRTVSLRPFYNEVERLIRAEHKRFDFPSCAPHATGQWADYVNWLDALLSFSDWDLLRVRNEIVAFVLQRLPSHEFDPSTVQSEPPLFRRLLEGFELAPQPGEPTGAAYQGVVFGFLRADNPHLQIEIDKVRTGSKRLQRVGDVDGWDGSRLAISAEVKQFRLAPKALADIQGFANAVSRRGAIGMVVALGFDGGTREAIEALGVRALDTDDLLSVVQLWDPLKQRTGVRSMLYYVRHVEKNGPLSERLEAFIARTSSAAGPEESESPKES